MGLDIGSSAVKAIELKAAGKAFRVAAFGTQPVPPDSIIDASAVAAAIRRLFEDNKAFKAKDVCASLSGNAVIVKKITLPVMTTSEFDDSIYWEAEQYIPFEIHDVNLDYQILDPGTGPDSRGNMEVLLVAVKSTGCDSVSHVYGSCDGHERSRDRRLRLDIRRRHVSNDHFADGDEDLRGCRHVRGGRRGDRRPGPDGLRVAAVHDRWQRRDREFHGVAYGACGKPDDAVQRIDIKWLRRRDDYRMGLGLRRRKHVERERRDHVALVLPLRHLRRPIDGHRQRGVDRNHDGERRGRGPVAR